MSIKFIIEIEQAKEIPFLDILVKRCPNNTFTTSVYRKKTFDSILNGIHLHHVNTISASSARSCIHAFVFAPPLHSCNPMSMISKGFLLQNGYLQGIITSNINDVLNKNRKKPNDPSPPRRCYYLF